METADVSEDFVLVDSEADKIKSISDQLLSLDGRDAVQALLSFSKKFDKRVKDTCTRLAKWRLVPLESSDVFDQKFECGNSPHGYLQIHMRLEWIRLHLTVEESYYISFSWLDLDKFVDVMNTSSTFDEWKNALSDISIAE